METRGLRRAFAPSPKLVRRSNRDASLPENQICVAQAGDCVEINRRFGTSRPNFEIL
jgi:hypothetical protein